MIYIVSKVSAIVNIFLKTSGILYFFLKKNFIVKNKKTKKKPKKTLSYPVNDQG